MIDLSGDAFARLADKSSGLVTVRIEILPAKKLNLYLERKYNMKYENYYLDLDKISSLSTEDEKKSIDAYKDQYKGTWSDILGSMEFKVAVEAEVGEDIRDFGLNDE